VRLDAHISCRAFPRTCSALKRSQPPQPQPRRRVGFAREKIAEDKAKFVDESSLNLLSNRVGCSAVRTLVVAIFHEGHGRVCPVKRYSFRFTVVCDFRGTSPGRDLFWVRPRTNMTGQWSAAGATCPWLRGGCVCWRSDMPIEQHFFVCAVEVRSTRLNVAR